MWPSNTAAGFKARKRELRRLQAARGDGVRKALRKRTAKLLREAECSLDVVSSKFEFCRFLAPEGPSTLAQQFTAGVEFDLIR